MTRYTDVGPVERFRERFGRVVVVEGREVAVFRRGDRFWAVQDACPHMGASLAGGRLDGDAVVCHWHHWRFDLTSGRSDQREWACAAVSDDGAGTVTMTPFVTSFEPLFEEPPDVVDEVLSQVRGVIEGMGGRFQMESRPRLWNRCTLMLPVGKREERAASVPAGETRVRRDAEGGLEVLVVDDNPALRSVLKRYLERRGHVVTEAVDGNHALDIVSAQEFDRLIVDVQMPGKSGPEFYVSLEGVAPRLRGRTFFMTGGALQEAAERFLEESGRPWIPKPFDLTQLARTLEAEV